MPRSRMTSRISCGHLLYRACDVGDEGAAAARDVLVFDATDADECDVIAHECPVSMKRHEPLAEKDLVLFRSIELEDAVLSSIVLDQAPELAEVSGHIASAERMVFEHEPLVGIHQRPNLLDGEVQK